MAKSRSFAISPNSTVKFLEKSGLKIYFVSVRYFLYTLAGLVVFSALASLFVFGGGNRKAQDSAEKVPVQRMGDLEIKLSVVPKTATPGDTIWFVLSVINRGNEDLTVNLPTPQPARFVVYHKGRPVWRSDYGMMFAQVITPFKIAAGDSIPLKSFWLGKDNRAQWLPLGKYIVEGCFLGTKTCLRDTVWLVD